MAKSVGMARLALRCWWANKGGWHWTCSTWATRMHAERYLRHHAQRHR